MTVGPAPTRLVFRQTLGVGTRCFVAAAGLFCFFPTYDLLIRPGVPALQLGMLPMWGIALGAMALGLLLLAAAILGVSRKVVFDAKAGELRELGAGAFGLRFQRHHQFQDLGMPIIRREEGSDGPPRFAVVVPHAARKHPIMVETYAIEADAALAAQRIAELIGSRDA